MPLVETEIHIWEIWLRVIALTYVRVLYLHEKDTKSDVIRRVMS